MSTIPVSDTVTLLSERADVPKAHVTAVLRSLRQLVIDKANDGVSISIGRDFGSFKPVNVASRKVKVPTRPGEEFESGGYTKIKFVPSSADIRRL